MSLPFFLRLLLATFAALESIRVVLVSSHQESGEWHCDPDSESRVSAEFKPGIITLDGHADDWNDIYGFEFPLLPALDPDQDKEYKGGKLMVKVAAVDFLMMKSFTFLEIKFWVFFRFSCSFWYWIAGIT